MHVVFEILFVVRDWRVAPYMRDCVVGVRSWSVGEEPWSVVGAVELRDIFETHGGKVPWAGCVGGMQRISTRYSGRGGEEDSDRICRGRCGRMGIDRCR